MPNSCSRDSNASDQPDSCVPESYHNAIPGTSTQRTNVIVTPSESGFLPSTISDTLIMGIREALANLKNERATFLERSRPQSVKLQKASVRGANARATL
eukprot:5934188-Pyramimonas_sp.AAC.1